ncbi:molybdopterin-dependent oxidoreductase [Xanthobacter tagetidis]|uniref:Molybdopterin oxidoreductase n=1 Tax=Xanthobacter tagetidis TaxID=60216 RepID=A0A3L7AG45_9HYPH|nr:molybdopterin-dependent oxidoreductase [Xanthobacter tagetidis]MBB6306709.1 anaerobic selenocysteine-containing dehydrogenase/ferredoxin-NADP reductase [Xanthobacter tagetidis]RLP78984.1 molybdopterin oxidoreductase [Xanthobacter tagetidis]
MAERHKCYCTLCRSRCGSITLVENGRMVGVEPRQDHPTGGALCAKGRAAPELVHSPNRLTTPLRRIGPKGDGARWEEISWDEALDEIAGRLGAIRDQSGAEAVAFAATTFSGSPIVDSYEWIERFVRCFGSPNLIYAIEVCGWHKDYAHALTFGRGLGVPDYDHADVIVLWGHNPARTWLAQASRVAEARRRGAKVVVIDPKPDGSGQQADLWLRMRPGADAALAMGAIHHLIESGRFADRFVRTWTNAALLVDTQTGRFLRAEAAGAGEGEDFLVLDAQGRPQSCDTARAPEDAARWLLDGAVRMRGPDGRVIEAETVFRRLAERARLYSLARVCALTGLGAAEVEAFYALLEGAPRAAYYTWTGVGQHANATQTERAIATLFALVGSCDREGGNVWTVPPPANTLNDLALLPPGQKEKALGLADLPLGPPAHGWITARDFARAAIDGVPYKVRALMSFGTNFVVSQADTARNLAALDALEFHVHADMFMNPTAARADIVLPVNMPWERDGLRIGFEITQAAAETIQFRRKVLEPLGQSRADHEIVMALATRLGMAAQFFGGDIEAGWNYQLQPLGLTVEDLRGTPDGVRVPQPFAHAKFAAQEADGTVRGFDTPTRRVELYSERLLEHGHDPLPDFVQPYADEDAALPLILTTAKSGWFVHTSHRHVASLRRKAPDPVVEISPHLAAARGLAAGDWAEVRTRVGGARLRVRINQALGDAIVVADFGWWEACGPLGRAGTGSHGPDTANINAALSDAARDPVSGSVPLRAVRCEIVPLPEANRGRWQGERRFIVAAAHAADAQTRALTLVPEDGGALPAFLPGQHVVVRLKPGGPARAYSLTGPPAAPRTFSIAVRRNPACADGGEAGFLSHRIQELAAGDTLLLEPPSGVFTLPLDGARPLLLIANGIGITPFVSLLEAFAEAPVGRAGDVLLLHGCRRRAEHPLADRLDALAARIPSLRRITAYSRPDAQDRAAHRVVAGRLDIDALRASGALPDAPAGRPIAYICGTADFIAAMRHALMRWGLPGFDIFTEAFSVAAEMPPRLAPRRVSVMGADRSFEWTPQAGSLLDAALAAGIQLRSGCRVGQCESCAVALMDGQVAHRVPVAADAGTCLACQAVPLTDLTIAP